MKTTGTPTKQGLYDPRFEHDACGIGFVADIKGRKSHDVVLKAIQVLLNLEHRGACGCETNTGDGAGILLQLPHEFLARECDELSINLPARGQYGVGMVFLPPDEVAREECVQLFEKIAREAIASRGFADRVGVLVGDMFAEALPPGRDIHLFSNVLHDWDVPKVKQLLEKSFSSLLPGGLLVVHDAHINAEKTGPLPVAAYSALLMTITEGKCYSESEMQELLEGAGFRGVKYAATAADRSIITARKPK